MTTYYEQRETAGVAEREDNLFSRLPEALLQARQRASAIAQQLQGVEPGDVQDRESLGRIPVIRKSELLQAQLAKRQAADASEMPVQDRLFGGFSTIGWGEAARVFASPGPIYEPESRRADYWGFARALY
ncbi:MAG: phenylacetate--CoA ligase, partial [Alcaligenaceae bacterium]|nr:phenylacetate--CoA ligase [Alcaligenaceae bacterium]